LIGAIALSWEDEGAIAVCRCWLGGDRFVVKMNLQSQFVGVWLGAIHYNSKNNVKELTHAV
jgi:hypothetical protein